MGFIHMFRDTPYFYGPIMVLVLRSTLESWGPLLFLYGFMFVAGECLAVSILACWLCLGFQPCRGTFHVTMYQTSSIVFETMRATLDVPRWTYPSVHHFLSLLNFLHLPLLILESLGYKHWTIHQGWCAHGTAPGAGLHRGGLGKTDPFLAAAPPSQGHAESLRAKLVVDSSGTSWLWKGLYSREIVDWKWLKHIETYHWHQTWLWPLSQCAGVLKRSWWLDYMGVDQLFL